LISRDKIVTRLEAVQDELHGLSGTPKNRSTLFGRQLHNRKSHLYRMRKHYRRMLAYGRLH